MGPRSRRAPAGGEQQQLDPLPLTTRGSPGDREWMIQDDSARPLAATDADGCRALMTPAALTHPGLRNLRDASRGRFSRLFDPLKFDRRSLPPPFFLPPPLSATMASLAPPPSNRHRASSTNVRPALTLNSLGRRRSNSLLDLPPITPSPCCSSRPASPLLAQVHGNAQPFSLDLPTKTTPSPDTVLATLVSRCLQVVHMWHRDTEPSAPSSPRLSRTSTSSDDTLLPVSSPIRSSFSEVFPEKPQPPSVRSWLQGSPSVRDSPFHSCDFPCLFRL